MRCVGESRPGSLLGHEGEMLTPSKTDPNYAFRDEEPDVPVEVVFEFKFAFRFPSARAAFISVPLSWFLWTNQVTEWWERDPARKCALLYTRACGDCDDYVRLRNRG